MLTTRILQELLIALNIGFHPKVFPRRLTRERIFNNRLLFSLLFSGNFCGGAGP